MNRLILAVALILAASFALADMPAPKVAPDVPKAAPAPATVPYVPFTVEGNEYAVLQNWGNQLPYAEAKPFMDWLAAKESNAILQSKTKGR